MRFKIKTWVCCGFVAIIVPLGAVGGLAVDRTERIASLAQDLNSTVVDKTRIAANIVSIAQRLRFVDAFALRIQTPEQAAAARELLGQQADALDAQIGSYRQYVDSDLERTLLRNLAASKASYLAAQRDIVADFVSDGGRDAASAESRLDAAFAAMKRQVKGLQVTAETQARAERAAATAMTENARFEVILATGFALLVSAGIFLLLLQAVFRPLARVTAALLSLAHGEFDVTLPRCDGRGEIDDVVRALDIFRKNALALATAHAETKAAHARADALARHDALTGLPNRRVLADAVEAAIERSRRAGTACAVLLLDLDRFKPVNDVYGHGAGDRVLCEVARRLSTTVRSSETAARLGGDEFAIIIEFDRGKDTPHRVAKRIAASVGEPIAIDGRSVSVGASIGIAMWPADGEDAETLLRAADLAMFKAKRDDRGTYRFYEPEMDTQVRERADLEARIQQAIERGEIRPHYQPLVDLAKGTITGFEVLARWYDGERIRAPDEFIPVVEEMGLIPDLTYAVVRRACRDSEAWPPGLTIAVNVTPSQLSDRRLPRALMSILEEEGFAPTRFEIEITENALIGDISIAKAVIEELRGCGVKVSLDDFGTGYSSLHHLRDLKFDKIKIDRSFVQTMLSNPESAKIIATVVGLSRSLGMLTVAEGIEGEEHLRSLIDNGCQLGQGYHLGKPIAPADVVRLFERRQPAVPLDAAA